MKTIATLFLILLAAGAAAAGYLWYSIEKPYGRYPSGGVFVDIPHGASRRSVARLLEKDGVIRNAMAFEIYARRHRKRTLEAGEYFFDHDGSVRAVAQKEFTQLFPQPGWVEHDPLEIWASQIGVAVEMADERLTSWEAERQLEEQFGRRSKSLTSASKKRGGEISVDSMAAAIVLRDYLERNAAGGAH